MSSFRLRCLIPAAPGSALLLVLAAVAGCNDRGRTVDNNGNGDSGIPNDDDDDDDGSSGDDDDDDCPPGGCLDIGDPGGDDDDDDDCNDGDDYEFNVIWVANTDEGTVSKIDTVSAQELARYRTGPTGSESPSRTSVNLRGDVGVGNRAGSIVKIIEKVDNCVDQNGDGVRTSSGPTDVLPWGEDDCVAWRHELPFSGSPPDYQGGPRAVAWDFHHDESDPDNDDCYGDPRLWIGWRNQPATSITLRRLDGQTGESTGEVVIDNWQGNWGHGSYGGAIDPDGNFWALGTLGTLVRVHGESMDVTRWDHTAGTIIPYGLAMDADGTPWMGGWDGRIYKFDRQGERFVDMGTVPGGSTRLRGLAIDETGHAWVAGNDPCGLVRYDTVGEMLVEASIMLPGCSEPVGVSIDSDGQIWVVDRYANRAFEVDPTNYSTRVVQGLVQPYTYSDMTGAGLSLVIPPVE